MAIEYLGLSQINGPLAVLEGVQGAAYDEIVEMMVNGWEKRLGRVIEIYRDKAIIQVYEGTDGMALRNTHTRLTGRPMELGVSVDMLGRTFDGIGRAYRRPGRHRARSHAGCERKAVKPGDKRISKELYPYRHLRH